MSNLGLEDYDRLDQICDRFEAEWKPGTELRLTPYLDTVEDPLKEALLLLLVEIDAAFCFKFRQEIDESRYQAYGQQAVQKAREILQEETARTQDNSPANKHPVASGLSDRPASKKSFITAPRNIGPYHLKNKLGQGGMGSVWRAEQLEPIKRQVAIKLIRVGIDSQQVVTRFESERRVIALMDHPNIAKIFEAGWHESGQPYFVMELVDGIPITEFCDQNRLNIDQRLQLFCNVCSAVQHAHQKGVIHRDLKPSNILVGMVEGKPLPKVIDFGLAKAIQDDGTGKHTGITEVGQIMGTFQYMSPEQADVNHLDIDTRSDIYSLGIILYELLTGVTPIDPKTIREQTFLHLLKYLKKFEPPRPSAKLSSLRNEVGSVSQKRSIAPGKLDQALRGDLDWIVMKAIEKERDRRYSSASNLAWDIGNYLLGDPVSARPPSRAYRLRKYISRNRIKVGIAVSLFLLLVTALILSFGFVVHLESVASNEKKLRESADEQSKAAKKSEELAKSKAQEALDERNRAVSALARSNFQLAIVRWKDELPQQALDYLDRIPEMFRQFGWYHARRKMEGSLLTLYGHQSPVIDLKISNDQTRVLSLSEDRVWKLWNLQTGTEIASIFRGYQAERIEILPDGSRYELTGPQRELYFLGVVNALPGNSKEYVVVGDESGKVHVGRKQNLAQFTPDSRFLIIVKPGNQIEILSAKDGSQVSNISTHSAPVCKLLIHPTEAMFATCSMDRTIKLWNTENGKLLLEIPPQESEVTDIHFMPGSQTLVSRNNSGEVRAWEVPAGKERFKLKVEEAKDPEPPFFGAVDVSSAANLIAANSGSQIHLFDADDGSWVKTLDAGRSTITRIAFRRDGRQIVSIDMDHRLNLWNVNSGSSILVLDECSASDVRSENFSPNGKLVCLANAIYESATGKKVSEKEIPFISFHPDGNRILGTTPRGTVVVIDADTGFDEQAFRGHQDQVNAIEATGDGQFFVSASDDNTLKIWSLSGARSSATEIVNLPTKEMIGGMTLHSTNPWIAFHSHDQSIIVWDYLNFRVLHHFHDGRDSSSRVEFHPQENVLAYPGADYQVVVRDMSTGSMISELRLSQVPVVPSEEAAKFLSDAERFDDVRKAELKEIREINESAAPFITSMQFSPNGQFLATGDSKNRTIIWDWKSGKMVKCINRYVPEKWEQRVWTFAWRKDGKEIAVGDADNFAVLVDVKSENIVRKFGDHIGQVSHIFFNEAEDQILTLSSAQDIIYTWNIGDGKLVSTTSIEKPVRSLWASTATHNRLLGRFENPSELVSRLNDLDAALERQVLEQDTGSSLTPLLSPDGTRLFSGTWNGTCLVWYANTELEYKIVRGHTDLITCIAGHPQHRLIASGSADNTVRICDTTGQLKCLLKTNGVPSRIAFDDAGTRLLVAIGGFIEYWDLKEQERLFTVRANNDPYIEVGFHENPDWIFGINIYHEVRLWNRMTQESTESNASFPGNEFKAETINSTLSLGDLLICPQGKNLLLIDKRFRKSDHFHQRHRFLFAFDFSWNQQKYEEALSAKDYYASCFYLSCLIKNDASNQGLKMDLDKLIVEWRDSLKKDDSEMSVLLPPIARQVTEKTPSK